MEQLQIKNPCPVVLMRMQKKEGNYHCGSCEKNILDLRGQSRESIKQQVGPDSCVILNSNQLVIQPKFRFYRKMLFSCLTFLSVLGFSVKPLKAQNIQAPQDSVVPAPATDHKEVLETILPMTDAERKFALENQEKKMEIKALPPQKKKKKSKEKQFKVVGCPSF